MAISGIGSNDNNVYGSIYAAQKNEEAKKAETKEATSAQNKALGGTVTYYQQTWMVSKDGSIQSTVYSVTETGMTNAERMKKSMDERLEKQKEKLEDAYYPKFDMNV